MNNSAQAWLLDIGNEQRAATALHEVIQVMPTPPLAPIPGAPAHCCLATIWQGNILPVIALDMLLNPGAATADYPSLAVLAWQNEPQQPLRYGALLLKDAPRQLSVDDDWMSDPEQAEPVWQQLALSCFNLDDSIVPILDIRRLFTAGSAALANT